MFKIWYYKFIGIIKYMKDSKVTIWKIIKYYIGKDLFFKAEYHWTQDNNKIEEYSLLRWMLFFILLSYIYFIIYTLVYFN